MCNFPMSPYVVRRLGSVWSVCLSVMLHSHAPIGVLVLLNVLLFQTSYHYCFQFVVPTIPNTTVYYLPGRNSDTSGGFLGVIRGLGCLVLTFPPLIDWVTANRLPAPKLITTLGIERKKNLNCDDN